MFCMQKCHSKAKKALLICFKMLFTTQHYITTNRRRSMISQKSGAHIVISQKGGAHSAAHQKARTEAKNGGVWGCSPRKILKIKVL